MKKLLLETGVTEDIDCPHCGYWGAYEEAETRGDIEAKGYEDFTFDFQRFCPLCDWLEYEKEDEGEWYDQVGDEIDVDVDEDPEKWDEEMSKLLPPNPLTDGPPPKQLAVAKRLMKILTRLPDEIADHIYTFVFEEWANWDEEARTYENFLRMFLVYILENPEL
jgi:hypothetical protein